MMAGRTSQKRNVSARLREESWYLVSYEDDCNLRVLHEDEVHHIFPEDNEEELQVGDIASALWLPNGQYYDAKVLQIGADKSELMKERMRLEKAKRNGKESETSAEKKRKQPSDSNTEGQRKEKKSQKQKNNKENERKTKEKEDKKKKKEEDKLRQNFLLETRKSQAAARWASTCSVPSSSDHHSEAESTIVAEVNSIPVAGFTPLPLHIRNTTTQAGVSTLSNQDGTFDDGASTPTRQHTLQSTSSSLPPAKKKKSASTSSSPQPSPVSHSPTLSKTSEESTRSLRHGNNHSNEDETPRRLSNKDKSNCDPRRGLHFHSSVVESSSEEDAADHCIQDKPEVASGNCCREQQLENEALRNRIQKLHRRLNIALKAKTAEEVMNNRPAPGVLDPSLAAEYKMVELVEGSAVYWYSQQRAYCSALKNWSGYVNAAVDIFFGKEKLSLSCAMGNEKKSKTGDSHQPLNPLIVHAIIGKVCSKFGKDGVSPSQVVQKINMKCVEARRPQRIRVSTVTKE